VRRVAARLDPSHGTEKSRKRSFLALAREFDHDLDPIRSEMATTMLSFAPGLFVGDNVVDGPIDNLDLERFFRCPKGHERRIHGRRHAGVRLVQEGATLLPTLDAHLHHPLPFTLAELLPYRSAEMPEAQVEAFRRRSIMRRARSKKMRGGLLRELEQRYEDSS
jgi:hypothetical protein